MPPVYTVSQIVALLKDSLERKFPSVDIEGEISNWRVYPSGHAYFILKDVGAQLNAVLFARIPCDCRASLGDGRRVKIRAKVTMYPQRGECQLVVTRIKIAGEGELMARYLALKSKLEAEGLFDSKRKKPLPRFPRKIGLVTSPSGAVVHDMCRVMTRRFPNLEIVIYPSLVQGASAAQSIIAGIEYFDSAAGEKFDLIIVARGGGSFEDLFCFNDESLARAVAASKTPVISAVGHETDYTLCDFAADFRAGTPSIAAEIAVPLLADIELRLSDSRDSIERSLVNQSDMTRQHLDRLSSEIVQKISLLLEKTSHKVESYSNALGSSLRHSSESFSARLDSCLDKLPVLLGFSLERSQARFERLSQSLNLLSPYSVLDRGYSITTGENGAVIIDPDGLSEGEAILTRLAKGVIRSRVDKK